MPTFTAGNNAVSVKVLELLTAALVEIEALSPGEVPSSDDAAWCLQKLQRLIDHFNAREELIYNVNFSQFNMTANHSPHTIGPTGDFNIPLRPVKIVSAAFILNSGSSNPVDTPIRIHDDDWWAANPLKSQTSSISTDLYYSPDSPLGALYFWPICTINNPVRIETWNSLPQAIDVTTTLGFVQGYWDAIVLTLALKIWHNYRGIAEPVPATLAMAQREAMRAIIGNNQSAPRIRTDQGMPSSGRPARPDFDFLTGMDDN